MLTGATSPDNNPLTAVRVSGPQYAASFSLNADGTFTYVPMANPPSGFKDVDSFEIMANDGTLNSEPVTVTLNWTSTPVAQDDSYLLGASDQLSVSTANGVLANDFNPMQQIVGAQLVQDVDASIGTFTFNQDGSFNFTAGVNFHGIASFTYQDLIQIGNAVVPGTTAAVRLIASNAIGSWSFGACVPPNLPDDGAFRPATSQGFVWYNVINSATWPAWSQSQNFAWANNPPAGESPRGPLAAQKYDCCLAIYDFGCRGQYRRRAL